MSFFPRTIVRHSDKNGRITAVEWFGQWRVDAHGTQQSGPEMQEVWRAALEHDRPLLSGTTNGRVLLLGLGTGSSLPAIHELLSPQEVVAIEHDPAMVALAQEFAMWEPYPEPTIIEADALAAAQKLQAPFNCILVDLFVGAQLAPLVHDSQFKNLLSDLLAQDGLLLLNVYQSPEALDQYKNLFKLRDRISAGDNWIGSFTKTV